MKTSRIRARANQLKRARTNRIRAFQLIPRTWETLPSYLPFYILAVIVVYAGLRGTTEVTVISPFHVPSQTALPFAGETIADSLEDALTTINRDAQRSQDDISGVPTELNTPNLGLIRHSHTYMQVQTPTSFAPEVKGLSYEGVISTARSVLRSETNIYGDVIVDRDRIVLIARSNDGGPWESDAHPKTYEGLKQASRELAERIFTTIDPTVAGEALLSDRKYSEALKAFRSAALFHPKQLEAQLNLCETYAQIRHYDTALDCFREHRAATPASLIDSVDASIADAYRRKGDYKASKAEYDQMLHRHPSSVTGLYGMAELLTDMHQNVPAIEYYRKVIELRTAASHTRFAAAINIGVPLERLRRYDEAIKSYTEANSIQADDPLVETNMAIQTMNKGDLNGAIAQLHSVLEAHPHFAFAMDRMAGLLNSRGKHSPAIEEFRLATHEAPEYPQAHHDLGDALAVSHRLEEALSEYHIANSLESTAETRGFIESKGYLDLAAALPAVDFRLALEQTRKAIDINASYALAHYRLATLLSKHVAFEAEAISEYRKSLALDPEYACPHTDLGVLFHRDGKQKDSEAEYLKATQIDPYLKKDSNQNCVAVGHSNLSGHLQEANRTQESIAEARKSIDLWDEMPGAYFMLGSALDDARQLQEALTAYRMGIRLDPKSAWGQNDYGITLSRLRLFGPAIEAHQAAESLDPKNQLYRRNLAETHREFGEELLSQGKPTDAVTEFKKSVEVWPDDAAAQNALAWQFATSPTSHDPVAALQHAMRAVILSRAMVPSYLDTLAAALYANNRVAEAIEVERRAIALDPKTEAFKSALEMYINGLSGKRQRTLEPVPYPSGSATEKQKGGGGSN
jgi:tetratricopeptide (TPR) repeat protein